MTKSIKVVGTRERIKRLLVWHPINTDPSDDDKWTVRFWLPLYDVLAILAGISAYLVGSPLLNRLFSGNVVDIAAVVFLVCSVAAFVGVCIPRLWRLEATGKIVMSFLMTSYSFLVLVFPSGYSRGNLFITAVLLMATWTIYPRLTKLFVRGYREHLARKEVGYSHDS